ncbi:MAG: DUF2892 domain-containing protein [Elusimicrobia bacterium]|nr:DUF2892 domain-containing protein [Candidatus Liberimonas magnetica]
MKKNIGSLDRLIRAMLAVIIGILLFKGILTSSIALILGILAVLLLITSAIGFCPLYKLIGISSCCCDECSIPEENKQ